MLQEWALLGVTMTLDDSIIVASAAVTTAAVIILMMLLLRHRQIVSDAARSSQLAKDLWDAMNARLTTMDARIVDLMARVDVYAVRSLQKGQPPSVGPSVETSAARPEAGPRPEVSPNVAKEVQRAGESMPEETGKQILRILRDGPKTSTNIKELIGKSREHTARLMKQLFDGGFVVRNDANRPYVYEITENGRNYLTGS